MKNKKTTVISIVVLAILGVIALAWTLSGCTEHLEGFEPFGVENYARANDVLDAVSRLEFDANPTAGDPSQAENTQSVISFELSFRNEDFAYLKLSFIARGSDGAWQEGQYDVMQDGGLVRNRSGNPEGDEIAMNGVPLSVVKNIISAAAASDITDGITDAELRYGGIIDTAKDDVLQDSRADDQQVLEVRTLKYGGGALTEQDYSALSGAYYTFSLRIDRVMYRIMISYSE